MAFRIAIYIGSDILAGLLNITGDIKSISGSLGYSKTIVEGNTAWNSTEATFAR
jgi:hypothetical protein